jgi:predicted helicase
MSRTLINQYLNELAKLRQVSGTSRESVVREAFKDLLKGWARSHDLVFVPEYEIESPSKDRRYVDGALLHALRMPFGYWEAKDERDDLDAEIETKFRRGYPKDNIIFEDSTQAVLIQNGGEAFRCKVDDVDALAKLLGLFFGYQRPEINEFRKAVEQFRTDLPAVIDALRAMIERAHTDNAAFRKAAERFLDHARETINPALGPDDVREILIQHILTDELFDEVFPGQPFHKDNNVARELHKLEDTFFTGNTKFQTLKALEVYYRAIRSAAARIGSHHEKQSFLKVVYENFYKVYNPKAADRLGVVYTPNEIVRFMIESADWLCEQHFGRNLIDRDVEILDPATGTGTFIAELIEHFRGQPAKLRHKYANELHANEVGLLPYYVANLNIEATYAAVTGEYVEFPGLCLVDTLDNVAGLRKKTGDQIADLFGMGEENVERIKRQNRRKISVIIGNPPYNANQANENDNNKNREYPEIDKRIKETYIRASTAQKTKLYDMYARFFRWASDRLHEDGILAFVTNRSFIDKRNFDGFRQSMASEFSDVYIVDLGGDVWGGESDTQANVFGIRVGVAISFWVKKRTKSLMRLHYNDSLLVGTDSEKLQALSKLRSSAVEWRLLKPSQTGDWLPTGTADTSDTIPVCSKAAKSADSARSERAIFKAFSLGAVTARDDWVYGLSSAEVASRVEFLIAEFNRVSAGKQEALYGSQGAEAVIKWSRATKSDAAKGKLYVYDDARIIDAVYRPFVRRSLYFSSQLNEMRYQLPHLFGDEGQEPNTVIAFTDAGSQKPFMCLAVSSPYDYHLVGSAAAALGMPRTRGLAENRVDNITDWSLKQFKDHYTAGKGRPVRPITKDAIFHYVYAVLHDPVYREKYAQNLKREFPRIPFYADFWTWADWGERLMALHLGYEAVDPWPLDRVDVPDEKARKAGQSPKALLKADEDAGRILLDTETTLSGVPATAWDYRLGNRCALEWILDQYKEKTPKDPTIRAKFDTYRFADHKDKVIDLLTRVTRVSVETQAIVEAMRGAAR